VLIGRRHNTEDMEPRLSRVNLVAEYDLVSAVARLAGVTPCDEPFDLLDLSDASVRLEEVRNEHVAYTLAPLSA
jgi:hypothetical protein